MSYLTGIKINYNFQTQLVTLIITTAIIVIGAIAFYVILNKNNDFVHKSKYTLAVELFVGFIEKTVLDIMGPKFRWFTPYTLYMLLYIGIGSLLSLLGFDAILTSYTICLSMGLVAFIGTYIAGFVFQGFSFFKRYIVNPLEILTQFAPLISLTFRIFGNLTAGATILYLIYHATSHVSIHTGVSNFQLNLLGGIIAPPFHVYFDLFDGLIQTYIFTLLTLSYIGMEATEETKKEVKRRYQSKYMPDQYVQRIDFVRTR